MEISTTDNEAHQSYISPPRRRRSTFFEKRDSVVPQLSDNVDLQSYKNVESQIRTQEMSRYYEKLLLEKEQWKKETLRRQHEYHDMKKDYTIRHNYAKTSNQSRISYSELLNEDMEFLKAKPSIKKLIDSQQKLHTSVKQTMALVRRANELDSVLIDFCEDKCDRITENIIENSSIE